MKLSMDLILFGKNYIYYIKIEGKRWIKEIMQ